MSKSFPILRIVIVLLALLLIAPAAYSEPQSKIFYVSDKNSRAYEEKNSLKPSEGSRFFTQKDKTKLASGLTYAIIDASNKETLVTQESFLTQLKKEYDEKNGLCIFVHGYWNGKKYVTTMGCDLAKQLQTPVLLFDWESLDTPTGYIADREQALLSVPRFASLLKALSEAKIQPSNTKLVAHSMGNVILINGLANLDANVTPIAKFGKNNGSKSQPVTTDDSLSARVKASLSKEGKAAVEKFEGVRSHQSNKYELVVLYSGDETIECFTQRFFDVLMHSEQVMQLVNKNDKAVGISALLKGKDMIAKTFMPPMLKSVHAYQTIEYSGLTSKEGLISPQHSMNTKYLAELIKDNGRTAPSGTKFNIGKTTAKGGNCYFKSLSKAEN